MDDNHDAGELQRGIDAARERANGNDPAGDERDSHERGRARVFQRKGCGIHFSLLSFAPFPPFPPASPFSPFSSAGASSSSSVSIVTFALSGNPFCPSMMTISPAFT